jgi:quercetin 2,3-dioxygenase
LIHQDARIYAGLFNGAEAADLSVDNGRSMYVHVALGAIVANGVALGAGDALQVTRGTELHLERGEDAEVLVFDLPGEASAL